MFDSLPAEVRTALAGLIVVLITWFGKFVVDVMNLYAAKLKAEIAEHLKAEEAMALSMLLDQVTDAASAIVATLQQSTVDGLKEKAEDGKLTEAQIKGLADDALKLLMNQLGPEVLMDLKLKVAEDVRAYLQRKIEEAVVGLKVCQ